MKTFQGDITDTVRILAALSRTAEVTSNLIHLMVKLVGEEQILGSINLRGGWITALAQYARRMRRL